MNVGQFYNLRKKKKMVVCFPYMYVNEGMVLFKQWRMTQLFFL